MEETTLISLLTFTGDTTSVLEAFPQGVVATPGGTPTTAFEDLLTGLLITQSAAAVPTTEVPTEATLDPALLQQQEPTPAEVPLDPSEVNDLLVNFFNVTPSGVPLPSQRVSTTTTPTRPDTTSPTIPTPTPTQETPLLQSEPITLEQIRIRARSAVPTTTPNSNAPPLPPPVTVVPNPDGTVLARPPEPDEVRTRIPEIGAVAPAVTGLATSFGPNQQAALDSAERLGGPLATTTSQQPFVLPSVVAPPGSVIVPAPNSNTVSSPTPIKAEVAGLNPPQTPLPIGSRPTQPPGALVATPEHPEGVFVAFNYFGSVPSPNSTSVPTAGQVTNSVPVTVPTTVTPTSAKNGVVTLPQTAPTTIVTPSAAAPGVIIQGVEVRGTLLTAPSFPQTVAQVPVKVPTLEQSERTAKIASESPTISPTPLTSGEPPRIVEASRVPTNSVAQPKSVVHQTAEVLVREAKLTQTPGESDFQIRLHPAELGEIRVHLRSTAEGITAHLTVAEDGVRRMIESQLPDLRQKLADSGVTVNGFNVSTDSGSDRGQPGTPALEPPPEEQFPRQTFANNRQPKPRAAAPTVGLDVTA